MDPPRLFTSPTDSHVRREYGLGTINPILREGGPPHVWGRPERFPGSLTVTGRPPHVWGRSQVEADHQQIRGQTPTDVGNALARLWFWRLVKRFLFTLHGLTARVEGRYLAAVPYGGSA